MEKRNYPRQAAELPCTFDYYEGEPDKIDMEKDKPGKGTGTILDISRSGIFIITDEHLAVSMPVITYFNLDQNGLACEGRIVRTGLIENNPSEIAIRFARRKIPGETYIAVEFTNLIDEFRDTGL